MSWLGILLIGFAVTDLTHSVRRDALPARVRRCRWSRSCVGLLAGLTSGRDVAALLVIAAVVLLWGLDRHVGLRPPRAEGRLAAAAVFVAGAGGRGRLLRARARRPPARSRGGWTRWPSPA